MVSFYARNAPEHSSLSCNSIADELRTNAHSLFASFDEAETNIKNGAFKGCATSSLDRLKRGALS